MLYEYRYKLEGKSWAWKQGWLSYERDPCNFVNPHPSGSERYNDFSDGWGEAQFTSAVDGGYYDW